ncbi:MULTISPECIES: QueT transporter family protein [Weissella]|jgi:uncharacterized membrane protein|uniref:QueT transporter family protein n=1 Tax=Weissella TaxID=46255 RepID=UPI0002191953|nr:MULTISPECIES: QueT transporter family protein [Weissella]ALI33467.1 hypothetical protein AO080_08490 [Weissella cibaria]APS27610.1 Queuosine precursor transporter QueT [Weissella cibaria]APU63008.1 Queuosine precursor transporter QueT [Weissella cibaria]APU65159.1 Queuosine precursor transporter QueT [Weissella cibaria]ASS51464.1 Queuosine precursor transporter QueT [Weissella cibaria]
METKKKSFSARDISLIAVIAALYAVATVALPFASYGPFQLRFSEGFNHLVVFNKRYIIALTIGVFIANIWSPYGIVDMIVGTAGTLAMTTMSYFATRKVKSVVKRLAISTIIDALMMWVVAAELYFMAKTPFWATFAWTALGELAALIIGAIIFYLLSRRVDLEK